mgnify:CR=1 FL=1
MIEQPLAAGILGRAIERGTLDVKVRDLRDFTTDRHRVVDDVPYGGGPGMVLKPDPIFRALDAIEAERGTPLTVIMTSPQGGAFTQAEARAAEPARARRAAVRALRRVRRSRARAGDRGIVDRRLRADRRRTAGAGHPRRRSRGSCRAWSATSSRSVEDSFSRGLLDFPQFTRPAEIGDASACPTCCCRATTRRFGAGGSGRR